MIKILPYFIASIFALGIIMGGDQLVQGNDGYGAAIAKEKVLAKVKAKRNLRKEKRVVRRDARSSKRVVRKATRSSKRSVRKVTRSSKKTSRKGARSSKKASRKSAPVVRSVRTKKSMKFKRINPFVSGLAGGVVGGVASNVIGNFFFRRPPPAPVSRNIDPWTAEWYRVCAETFESFNARTGYFVTRGGDLVFCTVRR
jgi:hypothetical protein